MTWHTALERLDHDCAFEERHTRFEGIARSAQEEIARRRERGREFGDGKRNGKAWRGRIGVAATLANRGRRGMGGVLRWECAQGLGKGRFV